MTNVTHLPEQGIILDLDLEERPAEDIKPPFVVKVGGKTLTFADPNEIDWQDLAAVDIPVDLLRVAMSPEDRKHLASQAMPGWKFNRLMEAYYTHYDLEKKIRDAKRQQAFSG